MKSIPSLTGLVVMLASSCLAAADHTEGLSRKQFEQALRNVSTAPNYVLVTVIETNGDKRQFVCIEAERLVSALEAEHGFKMEQAIRFALASKDRVFQFSNAQAIRSVKREYSDQVLREARDFLAKMTNDEIEAAIGRHDPGFYQFCAREPGSYNARFPAVAHVLAERGFLCVRGCMPGRFYIDKTEHN